MAAAARKVRMRSRDTHDLYYRPPVYSSLRYHFIWYLHAQSPNHPFNHVAHASLPIFALYNSKIRERTSINFHRALKEAWMFRENYRPHVEPRGIDTQIGTHKPSGQRIRQESCAGNHEFFIYLRFFDVEGKFPIFW